MLAEGLQGTMLPDDGLPKMCATVQLANAVDAAARSKVSTNHTNLKFNRFYNYNGPVVDGPFESLLEHVLGFFSWHVLVASLP
jgi:hypothetical protein